MDLQLQGKTVLVAAASKGLGKAIAAAYAEEGAAVHLVSRNETALKAAVQEIMDASGNRNVYYHVCDITDAAAIKAVVSKTASFSGSIDILINNAGGPPAGTLEDFTDEDWQQAFELNLLSFVRFIRLVTPYMKEQRFGRIVNIASSSIKQSIDNLLLSNTFRAGINGLSKSLSQELAPFNILLNTLGPGKIQTDRVNYLDTLAAAQSGQELAAYQSINQQQIPIKRYGQPEEFARAAVFFGSPLNTYMTGQAVVVDGGMVKAL